MQGLGAGLMVVGALSFVLPLFGRQFILVKLLGSAGGSVLAGLILFVIGAVLAVVGAREKVREEAKGKSQESLDAQSLATLKVHEDVEKGLCPNCRMIIPLASSECPGCKASFGAGSAWRVEDILAKDKAREQMRSIELEVLNQALLAEHRRERELTGKMGECPSCSAVIPMLSKVCPKCTASFQVGAAWKVKPIDS